MNARKSKAIRQVAKHYGNHAKQVAKKLKTMSDRELRLMLQEMSHVHSRVR